MEQTLLSFRNQNYISIKNKNRNFETSIFYNNNTKEFFILLMTEELMMGERYKTSKQCYDFINKNVDDSGTDFNIVFNYNAITTPAETKSRIFYSLEKEENLKELLLLLI